MSSASECVKVMVRVRPMNGTERSQACGKVVDVLPRINMIKITKPDNTQKEFSYDGVFGEDSTQQQVYDDAAFSLIESVLEGYNGRLINLSQPGTIFAYGQTGCGKTHTMSGVKNDPAQSGIIPKAFSHIFGCIDAATDDKRFLVRCSYLEIYNEGIYDLLGESRKLALKEDPQKGIFVKDLTNTICSTVEEIDSIMQTGSQNRHTGETKMNKDSSRSHSIFTIYIEMAELDEDSDAQKIRAGKLNLVDLAGSERQSKTGATGDRLNEANKINLSLSALGNVISALVDGKSKHIPYRDSKLTRLLQDSLGGNTKTVMIAAVSPADRNYDQTLSTLRYASRAKCIKNKPHINEDPKDALLREYENEIKKLREMIQQYEGSGSGGSGGSGGGGGIPQAGQKELAEMMARLAKQQAGAGLFSGFDESGEIIIIDKKTGKARLRKKGANGEVVEEDVEDGYNLGARRESNSLFPSRRQSETKAKLLEREKEIEQLNKDREHYQNELKAREEKLFAEQNQKEALNEMMTQLEQKLVRGGAALNEEQKKHAMAYRELQLKLKKQKKKEKQLLNEKLKREDEVLMVEQHYKDLQEECQENRKNIKKLRAKYQAAVDEIKDLDQEHERNREDLLDTIRDNERDLKLYKGLVKMLMPEEDVQKVFKRCLWNESEGEWTIPPFLYKHKKVQFPTIRNAEQLVLRHQESQELEISDVENPPPKPKSKWTSTPRSRESQQRLPSTDPVHHGTKFSFQNRDAILNKFTHNLKNVSMVDQLEPGLLATDIVLGKEEERQLRPRHQRGKVHLEPIQRMPMGKMARVSKNSSQRGIRLPNAVNRVGSLEKIENPPHLRKVAQPTKLDVSFKATLVLDDGEERRLSSKNIVASYIQRPQED